ncbi:recombinase family protein [Sporosarcina saromensis]|uniref:Recombinase family protein n=1 Tax=Sporosarcina saromensis TaxID=359365 RepID=A0ABU4G5K7_9BACL|nr:recombinase family protein [Sporosarcina saromensis]MDW0112248.1 recombinase family protein [Sporosarcina saromensis]
MRVAIYIRVSTKMQEDKYSLKAQTYELTKYAESMGWEIVDTFKDVDSGTKLKKDGLEAMLDLVEEGLVDVVLCIEQDRLSRLDTVKWEYLKGILRDNNVKIAEPGNIVDLSNIDDEFISDIKNLVAQRSRRDMLRKMGRGLRQRTREGKVWGPQPAEYNYDRTTGIITINQERAWVIPFIDDLYLNKKFGPSAIANELNKRCKTVNGVDWADSQVVEKLKHKSYHGIFEIAFKNETISVPNVYPLLRSEETYNRIQAEIERRYNWKPASPHFLRGIDMKCASCGKALIIHKNTVYGRKDNQEYPIETILHSHPINEKCKTKPHINVKRVQNQLRNAVKDILTDPTKAKQYIDSGFDENEILKVSEDIKQLEKQKQNLQEKIDRLLDLYLEGTWPKEKLDGNRKRFDQQLITTNELLSERKRKLMLIQNKQINYDTVLEFLTVAERFDVMLDESEQQELIGSLFPTATLDSKKNKLILHAYLPQEVTVDIKIEIESINEVKKRETLERAKERYERAQRYLDRNKGITLKALGEAIGCQPYTLRVDEERFGPFKHLAPHWSCPELRKERIKIIRKELLKDPNISLRQLAEKTGIYRKLLRELIKEEGLRR